MVEIGPEGEPGLHISSLSDVSGLDQPVCKLCLLMNGI